MSTIQFDEEQQQYTSRRILGERVQPKMVASLVKLGVVKSPKQASYLLMGGVIFMIILSFYFTRLALTSGTSPEQYDPYPPGSSAL